MLYLLEARLTGLSKPLRTQRVSSQRFFSKYTLIPLPSVVNRSSSVMRAFLPISVSLRVEYRLEKRGEIYGTI